MSDVPDKLFVAANPWALAALAKREGLPTDGFRESDFVPDDKVYIIDVAALMKLPDDIDIGASFSHSRAARCR